MSNIEIITSFNYAGFHDYGKKFLETFHKHNIDNIPLTVVIEDFDTPEKEAELPDWVNYEHIEDDPDFMQFYLANEQNDIMHGLVPGKKGVPNYNYRYDAIRFAKKVFVYANPLRQVPQRGWFIWIDADVEFFEDFTEQTFFDNLDEDANVAYIGRIDWDHSEAGFLAFRFGDDPEKNKITHSFLDDIRDVYKSGKFEQLDQWHDSFIFDAVREHFEDKNDMVSHDIAEGLTGMHPWENTFLGKFCKHNKGLTKYTPTQVSGKQQDVELIVTTNNSRPKPELRANIEYACNLLNEKKVNQVCPCNLHDRKAVMVGGAPSYKDRLEEIRQRHADGEYILATKNSYKYLQDNGITPWACVLLDPRPHVIDYLQDADASIRWFVASQCVPEVFDLLLEKHCNVWCYHAGVGVGEDSLIPDMRLPEVDMLIMGGSTSMTRGVRLFSQLGFYKFALYGLDSSYREKPTDELWGISQDKEPQFIHMVYGKKQTQKHWSDPEFIAQLNDMKAMFVENPWFEFDCQSEGLMKELFDVMYRTFGEFEDYYEKES